MLSLKIKDIMLDDTIADKVVIYEEKTDKKREFELNKSAKDAIRLYLDTLQDIGCESYLFKSRKGDGALTVESAHKIIKTTLRELNIKGNYGTHSLRKTFAYHIYANNIKTNPTIINTLQKMLNHSSACRLRAFTVSCDRNSANSNHAGRTTLTDKRAKRRAKKRPPRYAVNMERA